MEILINESYWYNPIYEQIYDDGFKAFDKEYYSSAKLAALQASDASWIGKIIYDLDYFQNSGGFTAESHYSQYGYLEGLEPNQYVNHSEYILVKATAMYDSGGSYFTCPVFVHALDLPRDP